MQARVRNRNLPQGRFHTEKRNEEHPKGKKTEKETGKPVASDSRSDLKNMIIACLGCLVVIMFLMKSGFGASPPRQNPGPSASPVGEVPHSKESPLPDPVPFIEQRNEDNRWSKSQTIPEWLKDYFDWHKETVENLDKENWRDHNYIVMTCLGGEVCGNVAHRLRPMMAILRIAAETKRVFYIHWDLPDRLEKFLHPPNHGGINWTVPEFVMWKVRKSPHQSRIEAIEQQANQDDRRVVNAMYNDDSFAEPYYNDRLKDGEVPASKAFQDVWNVLFKPSFMLTERIRESLNLMGLKPGEYATAHIDYDFVPQNSAEQEELRLKVENAMNCMSQLRPGGPFLVAAQTYAVAREAILYGKQHSVAVHAKQIAHDTSTVPIDLFQSFVEILLMANSRCVAYNRGGYGQLGYILGYDYNCRMKYSGGEGQECQWKDPPPATMEKEKVELEDPDE